MFEKFKFDVENSDDEVDMRRDIDVEIFVDVLLVVLVVD